MALTDTHSSFSSLGNNCHDHLSNALFPSLSLFSFLKRASCSPDEARLWLLLLPSPKCWDSRCAPLLQVYAVLGGKPRASLMLPPQPVFSYS